MPAPSELRPLPAFVALEVLPVLQNQRRAATIRFDETYLDGVSRVLATLDSDGQFENRLETLRATRKEFDEISVGVSSLEESALREAAEEMRDALETMPEIEYLRSNYPGDCIVFPQVFHTPTNVIDTNGRIDFGARLFFFERGEAPDPGALIDRNIRTVVTETPREFEKYIGELLCYPECCIDAFLQRKSGSMPPEVASVKPLESRVKTDKLATSGGRLSSVGHIFSGFFQEEYAYAFFSREFFPEQRCDRAENMGRRIYRSLSSEVDERIVRDHFRLNYLYCHAIARSITDQTRMGRPAVGDLSLEHVHFYLPLWVLRSMPKYRTVKE